MCMYEYVCLSKCECVRECVCVNACVLECDCISLNVIVSEEDLLKFNSCLFLAINRLRISLINRLAAISHPKPLIIISIHLVVVVGR